MTYPETVLDEIVVLKTPEELSDKVTQSFASGENMEGLLAVRSYLEEQGINYKSAHFAIIDQNKSEPYGLCFITSHANTGSFWWDTQSVGSFWWDAFEKHFQAPLGEHQRRLILVGQSNYSELESGLKNAEYVPSENLPLDTDAAKPPVTGTLFSKTKQLNL